MTPFRGHKSIPARSRENLPAGGYVAIIKNAAVETTEWGDKLLISFDIVEGTYKDFFANDYKSNMNEDKKWRGRRRLNVPKDDGSEKDEWAKSAFGKATWAIEESNPGYTWDWNEAGLKGKYVGVLFREKEWEYNNQTGWTTECSGFTAADEIRNNKFKMPKPKALPDKPETAFTSFPADDSEIPFI